MRVQIENHEINGVDGICLRYPKDFRVLFFGITGQVPDCLQPRGLVPGDEHLCAEYSTTFSVDRVTFHIRKSVTRKENP